MRSEATNRAEGELTEGKFRASGTEDRREERETGRTRLWQVYAVQRCGKGRWGSRGEQNG
jgi:hypothetical protein